MSTPTLPTVELIQSSPAPEPGAPTKRYRFRVFFLSLLVCTIIGLAIVYGRSPIYRAAVSVLTVKPKAVDVLSVEADAEHAAIQQRLLTGEEIIQELFESINATSVSSIGDSHALRQMLSVAGVPDTNLLELRAEGSDPEVVQIVANAWSESYERFRVKQYQATMARTSAEITDQQLQLNQTIEQLRNEIRVFRETHDIVSLEREENRSLSSLRGLNRSLNTAREKAIEAEAEMHAIDEAIAHGETVVPNEQKAEIARLTVDIDRLRNRILDLQETYTQKYIDRDPSLAELPEILAEMESDLERAMAVGKATVRDEALQRLSAARRAVSALESQLNQRQASVQEFTQYFKKFESMEDELRRVEEIYGENEARLTQLKVQNEEKFPPLQIVEMARLPIDPISPNYRRDLFIALGVALTTALFLTWLFDYLTERNQKVNGQPNIGVRIYSDNQAQVAFAGSTTPSLEHEAEQRGGASIPIGHSPEPAPSPPEVSTTPAHNPTLPRELAAAEVSALLEHLEPDFVGYCVAYLCGVAPFEIEMLESKHFDEQSHRIIWNTNVAREIAVDPKVWTLMSPSTLKFPITVNAIDIALLKAARTTDLDDPTTINSVAIWHSYVLSLVRQGIDENALIKRVGEIPTEALSALMAFSPKESVPNIQFVYSALS